MLTILAYWPALSVLAVAVACCLFHNAAVTNSDEV